MSQHQHGQADAVEVTPAMIREAYRVFREWDALAENLPQKEAVRDAFLAMRAMVPVDTRQKA